MKKTLGIFTALMAIAPFAHGASCVPSAEWSGKLILPKANERSADGGIDLLLENAPAQYAKLKGSIVHLNYGKSGSKERALFDQRKRDVSFGPKAKEAMDKNGILLPRGLDGWKNVSPLESLAASRPNDVVRAEIVDVQISETDRGVTLTTTSEPQLQDGDEQCLVQFVSVNGDTAIVRHYNKQAKDFSGETEEIGLDFKRHLPHGDEYEELTLKGIETQKNNTTGFNIYGSRASGKFIAESVESYGMFKVRTTKDDDASAEDVSESKDYWDISSKDKTRARQIVYLPANGSTTADFKLGDKFLVTHGFGAFNKFGMTLGKYRGHSSVGFAEIVRHPISNELTYKVIYKQTYGHSGSGTFAATFHAYAYTSNLYRGLAFLRPTTDILYPLKDTRADFIPALTLALDNLNIDYRVGFGHGWARVTSITSCVHDTGNTLIGLLTDYTEQNKSLSASESNLLNNIKKNLGKQVLPPANFRNAETLGPAVDVKLSTLFKVRKNLTISIPRNFQDAMMKAFVKDNRYPIVVLQTIQPADDMPQATPHAPDRINTLLGTLFTSFLPRKDK